MSGLAFEKKIAERASANGMSIGGWQKVTLVDFPGKVASLIFTNGCVFRCGFCYNPGLVLPPFKKGFTAEEIFRFLRRRKGLIEGVVVSGGEPTVQPGLAPFLKKIKDLGFAVKLDTNGYLPDRLRKILVDGLADYVAMDIKAPAEKYSRLTGVNIDMARIADSIGIIMGSGIPYEFRSTIIRGFHTPEDIPEMALLIKGARLYYLQPFRPLGSLVDPEFSKNTSFSRGELLDLALQCERYVNKCVVR